VKGDSLEADQIVSSRYRGWDRRSPGVVLADHEPRGPSSCGDGAIYKTRMVNFKPFQGVCIYTRASRARALGEVG